MMKLLLLLNGNKESILAAHKLEDSNFNTIKIDDKDLAKPKMIVKMIKESGCNTVYIGCKELQLQRFQIFMKIYCSFSRKQSAIIDELGNINKYSTTKLFFYELPMLAFESFASIIVLLFYHLKYPFDKWIYLKKN